MAITALAVLTPSTALSETVSVDLDEVAELLEGDVRLLWMGDSFSSTFFFRVPAAALNTWPIERITAISGGAARNHGLIYASPSCEPLSLIQAEDSNGYRVERSGSTFRYFGLPVRGMQEVFTSDALVLGSGDEVMEFRLKDHRLEEGVHGAFSRPGDHLRARFLYRATTNMEDQLPTAQLRDHGGQATVLDLTEGSRGFLHLGDVPEEGRTAISNQINAALPDIDLGDDLDGMDRVSLSIDSGLIGSRQFLDAAGLIYYHVDSDLQRIPGLYYSYIADDSWSYRGFGSDDECSSMFDKVFSRDQLTHWMDVTTLDVRQPVLFAWYMDPEAWGSTSTRLHMEQMIDVAEHAAVSIGIETIHHLVIIPHRVDSLGEITQWLMEGHQNAAFNLAADRANVSAASIYAATDRVLFNGDATAEQWLLDNGFDQFQYGTKEVDLVAEPVGSRLLDNAGLHPRGDEGGAFFATILGDMLRDAACPEDHVPDGTINVSDLLHVIARWGQPPDDEPDAEPTGVDDLLRLLGHWGECWPVQAPFNRR
ncbi:MAG: hypothetical protein CMJ24_08935 [Phycisphaerae bacterium]|nr:hypothetical protein [Phycisphaerae bacterium]